MDPLEQKMKEKLLEGLVEHMQGKMGDDLDSKYPKKALEVSVAAPDKEGLAEGLEHAHDIAAPSDSAEGSDEDRLMELLGEDDDDDKVG